MRVSRAVIAAVATIVVATLLTGGGQADADSNERPARLARVTVEVTNRAPEGGTIQTPVWVAVHDGSFDIYDRGAPASPELERLAEDGNTGPIADALAASGSGVDAVVAGPGGALRPGESGSASLLVDVGSSRRHCFSYASMVIPSNDAFVANGDPTARCVGPRHRFDMGSFVVTGDEVLDAGTEVNDEIPENTAGLEQAAADTGEPEGGVVDAHPGFIPGGNVLSAIPNGDFTVPGYENLRFRVAAEPAPSRVRAELSGDQEVPPVDTRATGEVRLTLERDGDIDFRIAARRIDDVLFAHIHLGRPGENGDVAVTLFQGNLSDGQNLRVRGEVDDDDLSGPLAGMTTLDLWQEILDGNAYVNVHSDEFPSGELRADLP